MVLNRRGKSMKKVEREELRSEYRREDLGKGVRGKYLKAYRAGTNLVRLQPRLRALNVSIEDYH
jgi:hypothetical protein